MLRPTLSGGLLVSEYVRAFPEVLQEEDVIRQIHGQGLPGRQLAGSSVREQDEERAGGPLRRNPQLRRLHQLGLVEGPSFLYSLSLNHFRDGDRIKIQSETTVDPTIATPGPSVLLKFLDLLDVDLIGFQNRSSSIDSR